MSHLLDQISRHSVYTQRFAGHLSNLFDPYLDDIRRELRAILLNGPSETRNMRVINRLIADYRRSASVLYGGYIDQVLLHELKEFSALEGEWVAKALDINTVKDTVIVRPTPTQIWAGVNASPLVFESSAGVKLLEPFIKDWTDNQIKRTGDIIRTGFITGKTSDQISREIAGKNGMLDKKARASIKTMVRTSTNHVSNLARSKTLKANQDILDGYEIFATLDDRTSNYCMNIDGTKVFYIGRIEWGNGKREKTKFQPHAPFHPGCRTSEAPLLKKKFNLFGDAGTRASKGVGGGKQTKGTNKYFDFLKAQGAQGAKGRAFVEDQLGIERSKLFLDGGLSVSKFQQLTYDDKFRPLPLDQLREKESLQFAFDAID